jgi:hypothetical protein
MRDISEAFEYVPTHKIPLATIELENLVIER